MLRIVIVGGGAGGLELVSKLSKKLGKKGLAHITLVDRNQTHLWKPLLHEVAAGVIDKNSDGVDYRMHAARFGYHFQLGTMSNVDAENKTIYLDPLYDDAGDLLLKERTINYDYLVLAVGSVSNDFGTPGVAEHSFFLDSLSQAERFHKALLNQLLRINQEKSDSAKLSIAIVGGGATGTELAAELHHVANLAKNYGMPEMSASRLKISIIEAGESILPALPERIATSARIALTKLGVDVLENTRISSARKGAFITSDDKPIEADLLVWAAGVKAPDFIQQLGVFETNRAQQILVNKHLQSTTCETIFVLGDCCGFMQDNGKWVPPRAQSAHQMANTVAANIIGIVRGNVMKDYKYVDYGSLVHLSKYSTVGSLMGSLVSSSMFIEGRLARLVYISLYNMHQFAVHGWLKAILVLLSRKVSNIVGPKLKLH
ncbi:NAD(P)/FAD-dependent oxidoreductase [Aliiglaciecola sp. 2_MG-2023]|uniref:NAD(P)/FAD-dependent oxidoreductase n=1 Tax=unclassified Aliiglaciecola TaxID=2593648 RepID=UPI0026E29FB9|nr:MULTISPECIES: NAD(P)/FAD-dependent oxidoreductase [unclassified Aliiglaciecola]MDO6712560.1 NAD(P)/FAD-dependent oxidoreductase [Aliiglaciecola sp. 2_MG-2023]MDO6753696.1 NAD(P)/FAD-dependent oxidoreductase [Aliiglaciecola sp. 1_MG-2023]